MKKLALLLAFAAMISFVACNGGKAKKEAEKKMQDSLMQVKIQDSIKKVEESMKAQDTIKKDTIAKPEVKKEEKKK